ncbi:hypothetical protein RB195_004734 [Necator americanus]|uniref:Uncharacterized protein n=1 Tax=Necator americanus TaxID=51031 RepID=A0ABR1BJG9_NECAM
MGFALEAIVHSYYSLFGKHVMKRAMSRSKRSLGLISFSSQQFYFLAAALFMRKGIIRLGDVDVAEITGLLLDLNSNLDFIGTEKETVP